MLWPLQRRLKFIEKILKPLDFTRQKHSVLPIDAICITFPNSVAQMLYLGIAFAQLIVQLLYLTLLQHIGTLANTTYGQISARLRSETDLRPKEGV